MWDLPWSDALMDEGLNHWPQDCWAALMSMHAMTHSRARCQETPLIFMIHSFCRRWWLANWFVLSSCFTPTCASILSLSCPLQLSFALSQPHSPKLRVCSFTRHQLKRCLMEYGLWQVSRCHLTRRKRSHTQLDNKAHSTHDQETDTNSLADLGEFLAVS